MRSLAAFVAVLLCSAASAADLPKVEPEFLVATDAATCCIPGHTCPPDAPVCPYCPAPRVCVQPSATCTAPLQVNGCEALAATIQKVMAATPCLPSPRIVQTIRVSPTWLVVTAQRKRWLQDVSDWFTTYQRGECGPQVPSTALNVLKVYPSKPGMLGASPAP